MNVVRFLARDAADAVGQVRSRLGPEAVVVILRQVPARGLSRLWRRPLLEVRAALPESGAGILPARPNLQPAVASAGATAGQRPSSLAQGPVSKPARAGKAGPRRAKGRRSEAQKVRPSRPGRQERGRGGGQRRSRNQDEERVQRGGAEAAERIGTRKRVRAGNENSAGSNARPAATPGPEAANSRVAAPVAHAAADSGPPGLGGRWRSGAVLHQMGLQPILVEKVLERARAKHGQEPPAALADEMALARSALASFWRAAPDLESGSPAIHAFIGPPGSGKTTVLCKWLAKSVLTERRAARVWRLDSRAANFAGLLDFYAEILGAQVEREWKGVPGLGGCEEAFVDLPGVNLQDATAVEQLQAQLVGLDGAQVHLVLNAAYEAPVLLAQARGFDDWPVSDLILTHLDEEKRLGKLWNFVLGTKFTVRFLSGGQNVPGDFSVATPELLICQ